MPKGTHERNAISTQRDTTRISLYEMLLSHGVNEIMSEANSAQAEEANERAARTNERVAKESSCRLHLLSPNGALEA